MAPYRHSTLDQFPRSPSTLDEIDHSSMIAIFFGVIASMAFVILIVACASCCKRRKKKNEKEKGKIEVPVTPATEKSDATSKCTGKDTQLDTTKKGDTVAKTTTARDGVSALEPLAARERTKTSPKMDLGGKTKEPLPSKQSQLKGDFVQYANVMYKTVALDDAFEPSILKKKPDFVKSTNVQYKTLALLDEAFEPSVRNNAKVPVKEAPRSLKPVSAHDAAYQSFAGIDDVFAPSVIRAPTRRRD